MTEDDDPFSDKNHKAMMAELKVNDPELYVILEQQDRQSVAAIECDELELGRVAMARTQARLRKLMQERHGNGPWSVTES